MSCACDWKQFNLLRTNQKRQERHPLLAAVLTLVFILTLMGVISWSITEWYLNQVVTSLLKQTSVDASLYPATFTCECPYGCRVIARGSCVSLGHASSATSAGAGAGASNESVPSITMVLDDTNGTVGEDRMWIAD